jgi:hypothetical protein
VLFATQALPAAPDSEEAAGVIDEFALEYCGSWEKDPLYQKLEVAMPMRGRPAFAWWVSPATVRPMAVLKVQPQIR